MKRRQKTLGLIVAANEAAADPLRLVGAANALPGVGETAEVGHADNWFQVAPFGEHPHPKGLQVFDQQAAARILAVFNSAKDKLARGFRGLPVFVGHPDIDRKNYPDTRKYGGVQALEVRADGLWAKAKWSNAGKELVNDEHYDYQSPLWLMEPIPGRPGAFRPVELVSIGLTNNPNIPGKPVGANTADADNVMKEKLIAKLGLKPLTGATEVTDAQIEDAIGGLQGAANEKPTLTEQLRLANEAKEKAERERGEKEALAANERKARIGDRLTAAVNEKKITEAEKVAWQTRFETDFAGAEAAFGKLLPVGAMNTRATMKTGNLGQRNGGPEALNRDQRIAAANEAVAARHKEAGGEYSEAFAWVQRTKPELFKDMQTPEFETAAA